MHFLERSAVVAMDTDGFEGTAIGCAYVPFPGKQVDHTGLRKELGKVLPHYMLPSRWMCLDRLPQTANGKIDRRKLKKEFQRNETQIH